MKRDVMLKKFCSFLTDSDIVVFGSSDLAKEASEYYQPGHLYVLDSFGLAASVGLGLAMCTNRRVFVFTGEGDLLRNFGAVLQISSSKCQNIFLIIFNNGVYQNAGGFPNIFNAMLSTMATLFNLGCRTFNLTKDFERKEIKETKHFIERVTGPLAMVLDADKSKNIYSEIEVKNNIEDFISFIKDPTKKSALYDPFITAIDLPDADNLPTLKV
jgi:hypothetical protein